MDQAYSEHQYRLSEIEHLYGPNIHLPTSPYIQTLLTRFCHQSCRLPGLNRLTRSLYEFLFIEAMNLCAERKKVLSETRMKEFLKEGVVSADTYSISNKLISVNLARAGTYPSHICFDLANDVLNPENLRQDHFYLNRKTNEKNEVIGVDVSGSKIGGDQENSMVLFPDPMGATGGSLSHVISHYKNEVKGKARAYIALHLIITPEYISRMKQDHPDVKIFALRLDRGMSSNEVLKSIPGTFLEKERGLTDTQYIVPGAGGVGEILNNSFV